MTRFTKLARLHGIIFKCASNQQSVGPKGSPSPTGPSAAGSSSGSFSGGFAGSQSGGAPGNASPSMQAMFPGQGSSRQPFSGFATPNPYLAPRHSIHNPSPEQARINAAGQSYVESLQRQKQVSDLQTGAAGPYSAVPGMSDKQREMANIKDFRGYRQEASAPTTKGVKGEAIQQDLQADEQASRIAGSILPTAYGVSSLIKEGPSLIELGSLAWQGIKNFSAPGSGSSIPLPK